MRISEVNGSLEKEKSKQGSQMGMARRATQSARGAFAGGGWVQGRVNWS